MEDIKASAVAVISLSGLRSNLAQPVGHAGIRVSKVDAVSPGVGGVELLREEVDRQELGTLAGGGMMMCWDAMTPG